MDKLCGRARSLTTQATTIAQVHFSASEDNEKNLKTIGSIIYEESQAEKEGL